MFFKLLLIYFVASYTVFESVYYSRVSLVFGIKLGGAFFTFKTGVRSTSRQALLDNCGVADCVAYRRLFYVLLNDLTGFILL